LSTFKCQVTTPPPFSGWHTFVFQTKATHRQNFTNRQTYQLICWTRVCLQLGRWYETCWKHTTYACFVSDSLPKPLTPVLILAGTIRCCCTTVAGRWRAHPRVAAPKLPQIKTKLSLLSMCLVQRPDKNFALSRFSSWRLASKSSARTSVVPVKDDLNEPLPNQLLHPHTGDELTDPLYSSSTISFCSTQSSNDPTKFAPLQKVLLCIGFNGKQNLIQVNFQRHHLFAIPRRCPPRFCLWAICRCFSFF
jgi:hypothetical protein